MTGALLTHQKESTLSQESTCGTFGFLLEHFKNSSALKKLFAAIINHAISFHLLEHNSVCFNFSGMQTVPHSS